MQTDARGRPKDVEPASGFVRASGQGRREANDESARDEASALRRDAENLRAVIENAPDGIAVHREGRILFANEALAAIFGRTRVELVGLEVVALTHPDDRASIADRIGRASEGERVPVRRTRVLRKDGNPIDVEARSERLLFDGAPAVLSVLRDITATLRMERQLLASERMASVGTLAAGVAHEINNPLACVLSNLEFARGALAKAQPGTDLAKEIGAALSEAETAAERVRHIVQGLRTFSRVEDEARTDVDVQHAMDLALDMAAGQIRHRATLRRWYQQVPKVEANEARLARVFLDLVVNAAQSIPEGNANEHQILVATFVDRDRRVVVEIGDSGCGMTREVIDRVFDPFFTTKPVGVGTGLGLSVARNVVRSLGGEIHIDSMVGLGTVVRVVLPPITGAALRRTTTRPEPVTARRARVLVIDDEPLVCRAVVRLLGGDHDVTTTTRGTEALESIRTGARYDAILCDLMMPELTGMDMFEALAREFPDQAAKMIFLTGGTFTERARAFVEARPHRVASKPFKLQQLRALIRAMLVD
jgi:PAS domain S-box-containing protein